MNLKQNVTNTDVESDPSGSPDDTTDSNATTPADTSVAPSGASTWDVTLQASSRSTGTNKSITVRHLIKSLKKAMLHETPAVRVAINAAMAQLVVPTAMNKQATTEGEQTKNEDKTTDEATRVDGQGEETNVVPPTLNNLPIPPAAPPDLGNAEDVTMGLPPPPPIFGKFTTDLQDKSNIGLTTFKTSTVKNGTGKDA
jgi:hypothetical protein